jgi:methyl-accepting chemotaxis protein
MRALIVILSILLALSAAVIFALYAVLKKLKADVVSECRSISDHISALACGNLTLAMPLRAPGKTRAFSREIREQFESIRRSYNDVTATPLERVCYVGTDPYLEGITCAHAMAEYCGEGARILVVITVSLEISNLDLRYRGFANALAESHSGARIIDVFEAKGNAADAYEYVKTAAGDAGLTGIYISGSSMAAPVARALKDTGRAGTISVICHDLGKDMVEFIREGVITAALLQDPILQGHDSVVHMFNHLVTGWRPIQPRLMCVMDLVTRANCAEFWDFGLGKPVKTRQMMERMIKPAAVAAKSLRIAVLGQDWNEFFLQTKAGALEAAEELRPCNAEVRWIVFNQARRPPEDIERDANAIVDGLIAEKYDGLVSIVGLKSIVPLLNKAVAAGIPMVTFNSEPLGLLGMLAWLERTSKKLRDMTHELTEGSSQIRQAMDQIAQASHGMVSSVIVQGESTQKGFVAAKDLMEMLENAARGEKSQLEVVDESSELSRRLSNLMGRFREQTGGMEKVRDGIAASMARMREMGEFSSRIGAIVSRIDEFATQTNILSINASIQAAKASGSGKGFKVIADEIRQLANDSAKAVVDIADLVRSIQASIQSSIQSTERSTAEVGLQLEYTAAGVSELDGLSRALVDIMAKVQSTSEDNAGVITKMGGSSRGLESVMNETSAISSENNAAIEELSASTVEITAQIAEITKMVSLLQDFVLVLQGSLAQFNTVRTDSVGA